MVSAFTHFSSTNDHCHQEGSKQGGDKKRPVADDLGILTMVRKAYRN